MPLVLLAMNTGLRRGELFHLQWSDVNLTAKQLTVRGEKAKSGQTRHVPLNVEAMAVMSAWKAQGSGKGTVFPSDKGLPLTDIKKAWVTITEDAKLSAFRFHDLRHDFASKLVVAGVPLNTVRDLLGHSDLQTTLRYAHLAPDHKAEAVEMIRVALHRDGDSENSDGTPAWSPGCASTTF
jgi:integrase